ncbi:concanavalin A-like lectin/glucanase, partial [Aspergillus homomorphus CBS 101889]
YSTNWAGAVIALDPSTDTNTNTSTNTNTTRFTSISATITVPTPAPLPANSTDYQTASAWIGLDGGESHTSTTSTTTTTTNAILQTGVDLYVIDGQAYTDPWYEWYPDFARYYDEFVVNPGDELGVSVTADPGGRVGVCVVENRSSGASVTQTLTAPKSTATLAGRTAEWVVEGFASALDEADAVPFVGFEPAVGFRECAAVAGGKAYSLLDATALYEIV